MMLPFLIALFFFLLGSYYDLKNNKNIPEFLVYSFFLISLGYFLFSFLSSGDWNYARNSIILSLLIGLFSYLFYRAGQLGSADGFYLVSLSLLMPFISLGPLPIPFVLSVLIYSGVFFALYVVLRSIQKIDLKKGNFFFLIFLLPYLLFLYLFFFDIFGEVLSLPYLLVISVLYLSFVFYSVYRNQIQDSMIKLVPVDKIEKDDVIVLEKISEDLRHKYKIPRVVTEPKKLKSIPLKKFPVYTEFPPFLPFLTLGLVLAYFFTDVLFYFP